MSLAKDKTIAWQLLIDATKLHYYAFSCIWQLIDCILQSLARNFHEKLISLGPGLIDAHRKLKDSFLVNNYAMPS